MLHTRHDEFHYTVSPPPTPPIGEYEICEEDRDAFEEGIRKLDVCDMEEFSRLERSEKTIAILRGRWWSQTPKQDGGIA